MNRSNHNSQSIRVVSTDPRLIELHGRSDSNSWPRAIES